MAATKDVDTVLSSHDLPLEFRHQSSAHEGEERKVVFRLSGVIAGRQLDEVICPNLVGETSIIPHLGSAVTGVYQCPLESGRPPMQLCLNPQPCEKGRLMRAALHAVSWKCRLRLVLVGATGTARGLTALPTGFGGKLAVLREGPFLGRDAAAALARDLALAFRVHRRKPTLRGEFSCQPYAASWAVPTHPNNEPRNR